MAQYSTSNFVSPTGLINSIPRSKAGSKRSQRGAAKNANPNTGSMHSLSLQGNSSLSSSSSMSSGNRQNNSSSSNHQEHNHRGRAGPSKQRLYTNSANGMVAAESFQRLFENKQEEPRVRRRTLEEAGPFGNSCGSSPSISPIPSPPVGSELQDPPAAAPPSHSSSAMGNPFLCASIPAFSGFATTPGSKAHTLRQQVSQTGLACGQRYGPVASKAAEKTKAGMTEFAVIASEVYRQECRSDHRGANQDFFVEKEEKMDDSFLMEDNSLLSLSEQRDNTNEMLNGSGARNIATTPELKRPLVATPSTVGSSGSERLTPPPRVDRVLNATDCSFQPSSMYDLDSSHPKQPDGSRSMEDADDPLRGARMELLRSQVSGIDNPEGRLARALEDLNRQDVFIQSLKRQMQITQTTLDDTTRELEDVKSMAKDKQYKATEIRARAVQEKKRLEDLYEKEAQQSKKLRDNVSQLQREVATLKTSLRNARNSQSRSPTQDSNNAQIISMRAELVELRSQLAEAHAINIDDISARNSTGEVEELRKKLQRDDAELKDLKQKNQEAARERQGLIQKERQLREKLDALQSSSKENEEQIKENLQIAIKSAEDARAELTKTKANVQRLERERARARMHSSADVERAQKDLAKTQEELEHLKNEIARSHASAKAERREFTKEIELLKEQLENANQESLAKSTNMMKEQRKLQDEISSHVAEIRGLKEKLTLKDVEIVTKMKQIEEMDQTIRSLKQEAQSKNSYRGLDFSEKSGPKPETEVRSTSFEQTFKNEIAVLKSKLAEAQTKIKEETFRAQEERRVNKEDERDRRAELERLQKEKDDAIKAKTSLQSEVAALRKRLASSTTILEDVPDLVPENDNAKSYSSTAVPSNVTRLRSELAQARERLAAARENSRSLPVRPTTSPGPIHEPSAWSTRVMSSTEQPNPTGLRQAEPITPQATSGQSSGQPAVATRNAVSENMDKVTKVPLLHKSSSPRSVQAKKSFTMEELTRQLEESRKRLQTADKRLNGLVGTGTSITVVRESISDASFDGSIDEVVTEDGSIEVSHRRFADV